MNTNINLQGLSCATSEGRGCSTQKDLSFADFVYKQSQTTTIDFKNTAVFDLHKIMKPHARMYIVGGAVRNVLLGIPISDIDICSSLTPEEIEKVLKGSLFDCKIVNKNLGTVLVSYKDYKMEHTTFRVESYDRKGAHSPEDAVFTNDIIKDCMRRDFTVNALYYCAETEKVLDLCGGVKDLNKKLIRTVNSPEIVFYDDGLRLLRMLRFMGELSFKIEKNTLRAAKQNAENLNTLSKERIKDELIKILNCKKKYKISKNLSPYKECVLLDKLGFLNKIFKNCRFHNLKFNYIKKFANDYDCLCLFALDLFNANENKDIKEFVRLNFFKDLSFPHKECKIIERFLQMVTESTDFDDAYLIKYFDEIESVLPLINKKAAKKLKYVHFKLKQQRAPTTLKQLQINSVDILNLGYSPRLISVILNDALLYAFSCPEFNDKEKLIKYIKEKYNNTTGIN